MQNTKGSKKYSSVSISKTLIEKIEEVLERKDSTYSSKTEFIKDAIRTKLRDFDILV